MFVYDNSTNNLQIIDITWERIFLHLKVRSALDRKVSFGLREFRRKKLPKDPEDPELRRWGNESPDVEDKPVYVDGFEDDCYHLTINIAAADHRSFLDNARWQIVAKDDEGTDYHLSVSYEIAHRIDDLSRVFRYDKRKFAYTVTFGVYASDIDVTILSLYFDSVFMEENKEWYKRKLVKEAHTAKDKFRRFRLSIVIKMMRAFYKVCYAIFPKRGNNILLMTETKPYIWGNLLYIEKRIKERGLDKRFHITRNCREAVGSHSSTLSWVKLVYKIAKQDYIFVDDYVPIFGFLNLGDKTQLIQVWHAGVGFKSVGYARFGKAGTPYPAESSHKKYDHALVGSENLIHVYEEVFGIEREAFLPVGMARLDDYLNHDKINAFKEQFYSEHPECLNKKLILFAPTFRGTGQRSATYGYARLDYEQIYDFCGEEYIFAFKMHPFIKKRPEFEEGMEYLSERLIDLSDYENINDLFYVTDILITDYSSAYYEFSIFERPIIFFTYDRERYEIQRGVHKSIKEEAPGKVCDTFKEMMDALRDEDFDLGKTKKFKEENFSNYDGHAADRAIDALLPLNDEGKKYNQQG